MCISVLYICQLEISEREDSLLLLFSDVFGWTSSGLELLSSLDLLLGHCVLPRLGVLELLLQVMLSSLLIEGFLLFLALNGGENPGGVRLGLEDGVFGDLLFVDLRLADLFEHDLVLRFQGFLSLLTTLSGLAELLSLFLSLLNDDVDELSPLLNGYFHLDIKSSSDSGRLLNLKVRSSLPGSRQSLVRNLTDSLGLL